MKNVIASIIVVGVIAALIAGLQGAVASPPVPVVEGTGQAERANHLDHHKMGVDAYKAGSYELAVRHLFAAHRAAPDSVEVARALVIALHEYVQDLLAKREHIAALYAVNDVAVVLLNLRQKLEDPESPARPFGTLLSLESDLNRIHEQIQSSAREFSLEYLQQARERADAARRWYWANSRGRVLKGLRALRHVHERYEALDADTQGEFHRVLNILKSRVSNKEWESLLASAGLG